MSSTSTLVVTSTVAASAAASSTAASKAPAQAGIFEGLNPAAYNASDPIVLFIIQASIVLILTRLLYWPLEVITGIILGPSVMGRIPNFTTTIFPTASMPAFSLAANIGLIFYLFLVGLEIDLRFLARNWRVAISVASLDMCVPFGMGYAIAYGIYEQFKDEPGIKHIPFATFGLFVAIAISITAFPVLCRILSSLNLLNANVGVITLTSGIANDVVGWVLLALCVTLVNAGNGLSALYVLLTTAGYALFLAYAVRPAFMWMLRKSHSLENGPSQTVVAITVLMVMFSSFFTSIIGAHSVFGAFMIGLMCPHEGGFAIKLTEKLEDMITTLFLPLYFARSGLSTNLGLLDSGVTWGYVIAIIVVAFASKIFGGTMGARLNGLLWRESATIGVLMSCKGLVELIVLNIGLQARILSTRTFTMFVVMALVTTFTTTPLVSFIYPPSYQRKLELWRQGKIDWDGNRLHPEEDHDTGALKSVDVADNLLVYLRADGLSSLFNIVNLFTGAAPSSTPTSTIAAAAEKSIFTTAMRPSIERTSTERSSHHKRLCINSIRLSELSERNSSVMKVSDPAEEYAGNDTMVKAFGTIAHTAARDVIVSGDVAVVPEQSFAQTLSSRASRNHSDLVLVPWSETGTLSELPSYTAGNNQLDPLANRDYMRFVEDLFDATTSISNVGIVMDKTFISARKHQSANVVTFTSADSKETNIHVFYTSTADDLFAVKLALQLAQNPRVRLTITQLATAATVSSEDAHIHDTSFNDLRSHGSSLAANAVTYSTLDEPASSASLIPNFESQNALCIVGRSVARSGAEVTRVRSNDAARSLGPVATELIGALKKSADANASVLIVQAKDT
ncbi:hypothetical protein DM02DRAFT_717016 [Periconia macrospinosa]|uniref:Cation/H+ exchanger transmembrane domain-containing protein n=1 Tax=Periconia macrospinosa TaxID=97972 RepID=A0A2V1DYG3_9PLEO|nr:hypothetical protein DM02DRAFT_717016 [Periconia macrospinosa]